MPLDPVAIPGIAPDRAFRGASGQLYRIRVKRVEQDIAQAAPNISPALVAPTSIVLSVTLAVVDEQGYVLKLGDKYRIGDRRELGPLNAAAMADLPTLIEREIAALIDDAEERLVGMPETLDYLATEWGIDLTPPQPVAPVFINIPSPPREMTAADIFLPDEAEEPDNA